MGIETAENTTETTGTEPTAPAVETPAASAPAEGAGDNPASPDGAGQVQAGQAGAVVPPPYQPNLTFRVRDAASGRQIEKKFDDWLVPLVKDAQTEQKAREILEKSYGLDAVKATRERLSNENQRLTQVLKQEYEPLQQTAQQIVHFRDQGNLPAVFQLLGINPQDVFSWAYKYASSSPEARSQMDQAARTGLEAYSSNVRHISAQSQAQQQAADFKTREFQLLAQYDPHVSSTIQEFDSQHGQGAFFEQVRMRGMYVFQTTGQDIPVQQAVQDVLKTMGRAQPAQPMGQAPLGAAPSQVPQQSGAVPQAPTQKPVIPSITGTGSSPVKRVYRSMEDIKKRRKELEAAND